MSETAKQPTSSGRGATLVAAGILLTRLVGLVRQKLLAHFLGNGLEAAAFSAATRIPNFLQNLLGEGALSASFIPVYAGLRAQGKSEEADRVASSVFALLSLTVAVLVAGGVAAAPWLVALIAPGYEGRSFELTVRLVRVIFPGTGVMVLSAWCLGILNSHRRFFLSYAAPVAWNAAIIAAMVAVRGQGGEVVVTWAAWGTVAGSALQLVVQWPAVMALLGHFRPVPSLAAEAVRQVLTGFVPAVVARGVVQISSYVDTAYASLVSERAVAALTYSQAIALLPVSLFGMAISAAELPEMAADAVKSHDERAAALRTRLGAGLERLSFFVVPSAVAFLLLGDAIAGVLLESGRFTARESRYTWYLLLGSGVALLAQTSGRLYSSAFYALKDTRTPLQFAALRIGLGIALGYWAVRILPGQLGLPEDLGAVFITLTTGVTAWLEMTLLRRALTKQLGGVALPSARVGRLWGAAFLAGGVAVALKVALGQRFGTNALVAQEWGGAVLPPPLLPVLPTSVGLLGVFCVVYGGVTVALRVPQALALARRLPGLRRFARS